MSQASRVVDLQRIYFDTGEHDTVRAEAATQLADNVYNFDLDSAYRLIVKADNWSRKHNYKKGLSITMGYLGFIFHTQGDYIQGIEGYQKSIAFNRKHNFEMNLAMDLGNYGTLLNDLGDSKAVDLYKESIAIYKAKNSPEDAAYIYSYIGGYFKGRNELDSAIYYYDLGLEATSRGDTKGELLRHLAETHFKKGNNQEAFSMIDKALNIMSERNKSGRKLLLITRLNFCLSTDNYEEAQKCIELLQPLKDVQVNQNASVLYEYLRAGFLYHEGRFQEAYDILEAVYRKRNEYFDDELINLVKRKSIEFEYQEKKHNDSIRAIEEKKVNELKHEAELQEEKNHRNILWITLLSIAVIAGLITIMYIRNRRNSRIIEEQNTSLESQNKNIIDSINYAKRIQSVILTSEEALKATFPQSFVFNRPKDIIGGDFYWIFEHNDFRFMAVADCTGHGVPGALLSVVCTEALNRAVGEFALTDPAGILNQVRELVKDHLVEAGEKLSDGMDISLIRLAKKDEATELIFAGANSSIFVRSGDQLAVYAGDRQPIGNYFNESSFQNTTLLLKKGDLIFLTSDGYYDQFGGPLGKKMTQNAFIDFLGSTGDPSISSYQSKIVAHFENWKGAEAQLDDVCFVGIQID